MNTRTTADTIRANLDDITLKENHILGMHVRGQNLDVRVTKETFDLILRIQKAFGAEAAKAVLLNFSDDGQNEVTLKRVWVHSLRLDGPDKTMRKLTSSSSATNRRLFSENGQYARANTPEDIESLVALAEKANICNLGVFGSFGRVIYKEASARNMTR